MGVFEGAGDHVGVLVLRELSRPDQPIYKTAWVYLDDSDASPTVRTFRHQFDCSRGMRRFLGTSELVKGVWVQGLPADKHFTAVAPLVAPKLGSDFFNEIDRELGITEIVTPPAAGGGEGPNGRPVPESDLNAIVARMRANHIHAQAVTTVDAAPIEPSPFP